MKLAPEELVVTSFPTAGTLELSAVAGTQSPYCPTPATQCFVCPVETEICA